MVDQPKKTNKKTKFEMNPEVSDRDTKAGEIKMESRVISGGYRDDDGKYHPPKTANSILRDKLKKKAEIMKKTSAAMRKEAVEQLDEIGDTERGRKVLNKYVTRASGEHTMANFSKRMTANKPSLKKDHDTFSRQEKNRRTGISRAIDRLDKHEAVELDETLSVVARLKKAREMTKLSNSGSLERGKLKKSFAAMTMNRAVKLGWKGARNQMKKNMAKGASYSSLSAATKSRIEKLVSKRVAQRKVLARQLTKGIMAKESINESFALMLEGKRYHQMMNKNGGVKFDMRFKHFREKTNPFFKESTDEEFVEAVAQMFESVQIENRTSAKNMAAFKALNMMMEKNGDLDLQAEKVSRSFGVDINVLKEIYDAYN